MIHPGVEKGTFSLKNDSDQRKNRQKMDPCVYCFDTGYFYIFLIKNELS